MGSGRRAAVTGWLAMVAMVALAMVGGCGGPAPAREEDVFHEAALRPGTVPAESDAERELLARLPTLPEEQPVRIGDRQYVRLAAYASASGRRCAPVREIAAGGERTRVACEDGEAWVFVPDVYGGDDPFAGTAGAGTAGAP